MLVKAMPTARQLITRPKPDVRGVIFKLAFIHTWSRQARLGLARAAAHGGVGKENGAKSASKGERDSRESIIRCIGLTSDCGWFISKRQ
jgi:hypothetical protein